MLRATIFYLYAECSHFGCHCADQYHNAECRNAECRNAECCNAECCNYCIEGIEMRQLGCKVRRLLFLNRY